MWPVDRPRGEVRGLLYEDHHGIADVKTVETVVLQPESPPEPRSLVRVPGSRRLRQVGVAPKTLNIDPEPAGGGHVDETGLWVDLDVAMDPPIAFPVD